MKKILLITITILYSTTFFAQIELVRDINEGSRDSNSSNFITYQNKVYFTAISNFVTYLYKYENGIAEIVKDQNGFDVRASFKPIELNGKLYLSANINNVLGAYSFDGTNFTLLTSSYFYLPQILNDKILFTNVNSSSKFTLWITDGTAENTEQLVDLQTFSFLGTGYENAVSGNKLFFVGRNDEAGRELWVTDGTASGTKIVKDINAGSANSDPKDFFADSNGKLYFTAETDSTGRELYVTDGTENGTFMLKDFYTGTSGGDFYIQELNKTIFISKNSRSTDVLYISDGTVSGTNVLDSSVKSKRFLTTYNGLLYFEGSITGEKGSLLVTDGTANGTRVLKENLDFSNGTMVSYKNYLYFSGNDGNNAELWRTDGTESGTTKIIDIDNNTALDGSFPVPALVYNDELIFQATQFGISGTELWKTDGTEGGTQIIQDLASGSNSTLFFGFYATDNELLINLEENSSLGRELYKYVGSNTASTDYFSKHNIRIYYNDNLYINGLNDLEANILIYDIKGRQVVEKTQVNSTQNRVNLNLPKGFYIAKLQLENGEVISEKFIVN